MGYEKEIEDIAMRLAHIATEMASGGSSGQGEAPQGETQVDTVSRIFRGTVDDEGASDAFSNPQSQREAVQEFSPRKDERSEDGPNGPQPCKFCKKPIYLVRSKRTGNWYTTDSERRNDLHDCPSRR